MTDASRRRANATDSLAISLTVRQWQTIDATMDNIAQGARKLGDDDRAAQALRVREQGWRQVGGWQGHDVFPPWPPSDDVAHVALGADTWSFVLDGLNAGIGTSESLLLNPRLNDSVRAEQRASLSLSHEAAARVRDALAPVDNS